jgi:hypothetical protein
VGEVAILEKKRRSRVKEQQHYIPIVSASVFPLLSTIISINYSFCGDEERQQVSVLRLPLDRAS